MIIWYNANISQNALIACGQKYESSTSPRSAEVMGCELIVNLEEYLQIFPTDRLQLEQEGATICL